MGQVGHADSKMTMDVYAQLEQRAKREHGRAFDRSSVRRASSSKAPSGGSREPRLGHGLGHGLGGERERANREIGSGQRKEPCYQGLRRGETETRTRDTTIFSRVLYQLSYLAAGA